MELINYLITKLKILKFPTKIISLAKPKMFRPNFSAHNMKLYDIFINNTQSKEKRKYKQNLKEIHKIFYT